MKRLFPILLIFFILITFSIHSQAQCAMCAGVAESSRDAGSSVSEGINKGVMYIFFMPYIIMGTIGYFWWKARKKALAD